MEFNNSQLRNYYRSLRPEQKRAFELRAGMSQLHLNNALSSGKRPALETIVKLLDAGDGALTPSGLRPDIDWQPVLRGLISEANL